MFAQLIRKIKEVSLNAGDFKIATGELRTYIDCLSEDVFKSIVKEIGIIPENIEHDSTEENYIQRLLILCWQDVLDC